MKGRYVFVMTNSDPNIGDIEIYTSENASPKKGTFIYKRDAERQFFTLDVDGEKYIYDFSGYREPKLKDEAIVPTMFVQDLTQQYKETYPALERAHTIQGLIYQRKR